MDVHVTEVEGRRINEEEEDGFVLWVLKCKLR